jgi:hypothetical protein
MDVFSPAKISTHKILRWLLKAMLTAASEDLAGGPPDIGTCTVPFQ